MSNKAEELKDNAVELIDLESEEPGSVGASLFVRPSKQVGRLL